MYVSACDELHLHGTSVTLYRRVSKRRQSDSRSTVYSDKDYISRSRSLNFDRFYKRPWKLPVKSVKPSGNKRQQAIREKAPVHLARLPSECKSVSKRPGRCCQNITSSCRIENQTLRRIQRTQDLNEIRDLLAFYCDREDHIVSVRRADYEHRLYEDLYNAPVTYLRNFVQDWYDSVGPDHMSTAIAVEELTRELRKARLSDIDQDSSAPVITVSDCSGSTNASTSGASSVWYSDNEEGSNTVSLTVPRVTSITCESRPP